RLYHRAADRAGGALARSRPGGACPAPDVPRCDLGGSQASGAIPPAAGGAAHESPDARRGSDAGEPAWLCVAWAVSIERRHARSSGARPGDQVMDRPSGLPEDFGAAPPAGAPESDDKLHEECGVFGIWNSADAAAVTALGLHALQHRGQVAAGIVSYD